MARKRQSAAARAASLRNLQKARSVNSKIMNRKMVYPTGAVYSGGRTRRRRMSTMTGRGSIRGGGIGDYISKLGAAFTRANSYLKTSKILSRGLKGLAIPVGAIRPAYGAALEAGGQFLGQNGYGSKGRMMRVKRKMTGGRRMRGGRRRMINSNVYDHTGMMIY